MVALMKYWTISSQVLVEEAEKLGLEYEVINREKNLFRIYSDTKSVLFKATDCGVNSSLGLKIANDKELTYNMLSRAGLPLAHTRYISKEEWSGIFNDEGFSYPLVVKPINGAHGDGVVMNLENKEEVQSALDSAFESHGKMIVQDQIEGDEYRILVFQGEVIFAARRAYPCVVGDGVSTIGELIKRENENNPLRGEGYEMPLAHIKVDDEMLKYLMSQGFDLDSKVGVGEKIVVRRNSNVGTGGTIEDCSDIISEEYKKVAIQCGLVCQLGMVGVDLLTKDISSIDVSNCTILEIGATPGLGGYREAVIINPGEFILKELFNL